jgi:GNAT superfamily N-acetyltransferase
MTAQAIASTFPHWHRLRQRIKGRFEQGFYSEFKGYGLRRDLDQPLQKPLAKIPFYIRPLRMEDLDILLPTETNLEYSEKQQITWRRHFYKKVPNGCMVAIDGRNDIPCYMQWLLGSDKNPLLTQFKCFPYLGKKEALLEQAYTIPSHRGLGIMSAAMAEIAELAPNLGARYVLTFVEEKGAASLKACQRAGFLPYLEHKRVQMGYGMIVRNSFKKLSAANI